MALKVPLPVDFFQLTELTPSAPQRHRPCFYFVWVTYDGNRNDTLLGVLYDWVDLWWCDFCPFYFSLTYHKIGFAIWLKHFSFQWIFCVPMCTGKKKFKFYCHYSLRLEFLKLFLSVAHFSYVLHITHWFQISNFKLSSQKMTKISIKYSNNFEAISVNE